jgi:hypothetical protein
VQALKQNGGPKARCFLLWFSPLIGFATVGVADTFDVWFLIGI